MKLTDVLAYMLKTYEIERVHGVTGGAVVHIFDSVKAVGIEPVFYQNEQAASFGAIGETKITKRISCCVVTTGPGGTNAITGVASAWVDSLPLLVISGQARLEHVSYKNKVRQLGTQEIDIVSIVSSITKRACTLEHLSEFTSVLESMVADARAGRAGPVWLDIPLDFQWATIDFSPSEPLGQPLGKSHLQSDTSSSEYHPQKQQLYVGEFDTYIKDLKSSSRPSFLIGGGVAPKDKIRLTNWLSRNSCPYTLTYNSLERTDGRKDPMNFGVIGIAGRRDANALIHNSDNLTIIGTHLPLPLTGAMTPKWCQGAQKTIVNIDYHEIAVSRFTFAHKFPVDSGLFIDALISHGSLEVSSEWTAFCTSIRGIKEPTNIPKQPYVDQYQFLEALSDSLGPNDIITVDGGGTINASAFTTIRPYETTPIVMSAGMCSMGSGIPEAIGASLSGKALDAGYILLIGDGGLQFNIQELATVHALGLPLKIFIICNGGYSSIRVTQKQFLDSRWLGVSEQSGIFMPSVADIAKTYHLEYHTLNQFGNLLADINSILKTNNPALIEVFIDPDQPIGPTQGFRPNKDGTFSPSPLHSMNPALGADEEKLLKKWVSE